MIPGYAPTFIRDPLLGYLVAAIVGAALVVGVTWLLGWLLARGKKGTQPPSAPTSAS